MENTPSDIPKIVILSLIVGWQRTLKSNFNTPTNKMDFLFRISILFVKVLNLLKGPFIYYHRGGWVENVNIGEGVYEKNSSFWKFRPIPPSDNKWKVPNKPLFYVGQPAINKFPSFRKSQKKSVGCHGFLRVYYLLKYTGKSSRHPSCCQKGLLVIYSLIADLIPHLLGLFPMGLESFQAIQWY